jgi:hypothetical protein
VLDNLDTKESGGCTTGMYVKVEERLYGPLYDGEDSPQQRQAVNHKSSRGTIIVWLEEVMVFSKGWPLVRRKSTERERERY